MDRTVTDAQLFLPGAKAIVCKRTVRCLLAVIACVLSRPCPAQTTTLISRNSAGDVADSAHLPTTGLEALSADGWFVVFASFIPDFVPGDTNGVPDVFLRNRHDNTTTRISVSSDGSQGDGISGLDPEEFDGSMGLSLTGRFIAFPSAATNLVPIDTNGVTDIFVRDTLTNTTSLVSVSTTGQQSNRRSVHCGVSPSADGRYIVFDSDADNLVTGDTNVRRDIFLRDRVANTTERVSIATNGDQANQDCSNPSVSADGRYVVFTSGSSTLAPGGNPGRSIFLRDRTLGQTFLVAVSYDPLGGCCGNEEVAGVSDDGRLVVFKSNDPALSGQNFGGQTYVKDRQTGITTLVSVSSGGAPADADSDFKSFISPNGRFVGFASRASNLVPQGGGCNEWQAYVRDRTLDTTTLASVSPLSTPGDGEAGAWCLVSADGSVAVFSTEAANLVPGDTNGRGDIYVRDFASSTTSRASISSSGFQGTAYVGLASAVLDMTPDARYVVLLSESENMAPCINTDDPQVYVRDLASGMTELISVTTTGGGGNNGGEADGVSDAGAISDNGRFVAFTSEGSRIVAGDSNNAGDVFLRDRQMQTTTRISVTTGGVQHNGVGFTDAPSISADGRYVAFHSDASNLAGIPDTNNSEDVFVHDTQLNTTLILSLTPGGTPGNSGSYGAVISADGQRVAFTSDAGNLIASDTNNSKDVFLVQRASGPAARLSVATGGAQSDGDSFNASISGEGRFVAFISTATNLVTNDTNGVADVFVRDVFLGMTIRVSVDSSGLQASGPSIGYPVISRDGRFVAFTSDAANLVASDTNGVTDTFVHDTFTHRTLRVSIGASGQQGNLAGGLEFPSTAISGDGRYVAFSSFAGNLVAGDTNNASDAFLRDTLVNCRADFNGDGFVNSQDFFDFLAAFFMLQPAADFNHDTFINSQDFFDFLAAFFSGC